MLRSRLPARFLPPPVERVRADIRAAEADLAADPLLLERPFPGQLGSIDHGRADVLARG
jgi:hypothetical protein